jgi:hypothetical protein
MFGGVQANEHEHPPYRMFGVRHRVRFVYGVKPFHKDELIARIHSIVRRSNGHAQSVILTGDLAVNLDQEDRRRGRRARERHWKRIQDPGVTFPA